MLGIQSEIQLSNAMHLQYLLSEWAAELFSGNSKHPLQLDSSIKFSFCCTVHVLKADEQRSIVLSLA